METEALKRRQLRPSVCFSAVEKCHVSRSRGHLQLKTDILQTHFTHSTADGWLWHFQRWHANDSSSVLPAAPLGAAVEMPLCQSSPGSTMCFVLYIVTQPSLM